MNDSRPIGIFDSGVGGLTVARRIEEFLPSEDVVYFGDTARVPYGTKSRRTITRFSVENVEFLMRHDVKMVVVACNTASALALDFLKRCFKVPVIGVIEPGARSAIRITRSRTIGVIGTQATVSSGAYERTINKLDRKMSVVAKSCPLFVPLVEEGWAGTKIAYEIASIYLKPLKAGRLDTLVLGCTHYPILAGVIKKVMGKGVSLIDSAEEVAKEAKGVLKAGGLLKASGKAGRYTFMVSDEPGHFAKMGEAFLRRKIDCVKRVA